MKKGVCCTLAHGVGWWAPDPACCVSWRPELVGRRVELEGTEEDSPRWMRMQTRITQRNNHHCPAIHRTFVAQC
ncbi:hypothetical protein AYX14_02926 [Cryptococcus neoformans]|nr:hypothetical protein AYX15_03902 [Cryptococcus neoformans var. grubii]OWZ71648.1 hypothetical protein AYX14_02926 [Cryptococcus neoformans var. grubii]